MAYMVTLSQFQLSILHKKVVANIIPENQIERLFLLFKVWVIGPSAQLLDPGVVGLGKLLFRSLRRFADSTVTRGPGLVSNFDVCHCPEE